MFERRFLTSSPRHKTSTALCIIARHTAPPAAGQATKRNGGKQVFAIAGDIGQTKYSNETFQHILGLIEAPSANETSPEALIIVGDLAYADGSSARWDTFAELMSPVTSRIPLLTLPGNHEVEFDDLDNTSAFVHFVKRYHMPGDYSDPTALRPVLYGNASEYYGWDVAYDGGSSCQYNVGLRATPPTASTWSAATHTNARVRRLLGRGRTCHLCRAQHV